MRRFVALLLLVLLPLQAIWAAAAPYCQHEEEAASHHIGHHQHEHAHALAADASDVHGSPGDQDGDAASTHTDCHTCHGGTVLAHEVRPRQVMLATTQHVPPSVHGLPAPPAERPDRPSWPALARSARWP